MNKNNDIIAGVDIGGTSVKCILFDKAVNRFSELNKRMLVKCVTSEEEVEKNISSLIIDTMSKNGYGNLLPAAIGVSSAALFDKDSGDIVNWPNNPLWNGFPLQRHLSARFNANVVMEDDANACTLAEAVYGTGKGCSNMAYITISTGIGCGLILNKSLYKGTNGWAGELGHIRMPHGNTVCVCGKTGCLQSMASGRALYKKAIDINKQQSTPVLINNLEDVTRLAQQDIPWAVKLFEEAGACVAYGLEYLVMLLDIDLFVLGGGVTQAGDLFIQPVRHHLQQLLQTIKRKASVEISTLQDKGGALGAVQLVLG